MLTLIIGGAGSGKSAFAESLCCRLSGRRVYLATMEALDEESRRRAEKHRRQRAPLGFETLECPRALEAAEIPAGANVLLEDLSNLLANEMFSPNGGGADAVRAGLEHVLRCSDNLTIMTNDVFSGGADYGEETRNYMRALAAFNRNLAARADMAVEVVCGLPNVLKGELP